MNERPEIGRRIAAAQDAMVDQLDATRGQRRARFVAAARRPSRSRGAVPWIAFGGAALAAGLIALVWLAKPPPETTEPAPHEVAHATPTVPAADDITRTISLEGGATITVPTDTAIAVPSPDDPRVVLRRGRMKLAASQPGQSVEVQAGDFRVVGSESRASIAWDPDEERIDVSVEAGQLVVERVTVGTRHVVVAGESVQLSAVEVTTSPRIDAPDTEAPTTPGARKKRSTPTWRTLAADGKHTAAVAAAEAKGFARVVKSAGADDLLTLARAARYAKAPARAREALQAVRKRFPRTNAAAKAAYALGRIAFDTQRKYGAAATWFQTYLDERPSGALKREALGRLVESHRRNGASGPAKRAAQRYLDRYPDGPHADIARQAL